MELFAQLEEHLKADKDYLNKKIVELTSGKEVQEDLITDIFELSEFINLQNAIKDGSSLANEVPPSLTEFAKQADEATKDRHLETIKKILLKEEEDIRSKGAKDANGNHQRVMLALEGVEERKEPLNVDEEELIKLYGPRIQVLQWLYECDSLKVKKERTKSRSQKKRKRGDLFDDYSSEVEIADFQDKNPDESFENIDGTTYQLIKDMNACNAIEE